MNVEIGRAAVQELEDAVDFYTDSAGAALAEDFLKEVEHAIDVLSISPLLGALFGHGFRRFRLRRFPYSPIYKAGASLVRIVAVAHDKRKPNYWRSRK